MLCECTGEAPYFRAVGVLGLEGFGECGFEFTALGGTGIEAGSAGFEFLGQFRLVFFAGPERMGCPGEAVGQLADFVPGGVTFFFTPIDVAFELADGGLFVSVALVFVGMGGVGLDGGKSNEQDGDGEKWRA